MRDLILRACQHSVAIYSGSMIYPLYHHRSTTVALYREPDYDVLVWCGTNDWRDFLLDVTALPWRYNGHWIHAGFRYAHGGIWDKIKKDLRPGVPLLLTGHSLGGALAEITATFLRDWGTVHLVTFGKPNVFLKRSAPPMPWLTTQVSVVAGSDIVTRSPRFLYGPSKTQHKLYLANNGEVIWNPTKRYQNADYNMRRVFDDHSGALYFERVKQWSEEE